MHSTGWGTTQVRCVPCSGDRADADFALNVGTGERLAPNDAGVDPHPALHLTELTGPAHFGHNSNHPEK